MGGGGGGGALGGPELDAFELDLARPAAIIAIAAGDRPVGSGGGAESL